MPPIAQGTPSQRVTHDGRHRYFWFADDDGELAVTSVLAITVAELATAEPLSRYAPKDGVQGTPSFNRVPNTDITSTFDAEGMGTWSFQPEIQLYIQHPDNLAFDYFANPANRVGLFVDFPLIALGGNPAAGDGYYAYRLELQTPVPLPYATNERQRFQLSAAAIDEPVYAGTLAAGE